LAVPPARQREEVNPAWCRLGQAACRSRESSAFYSPAHRLPDKPWPQLNRHSKAPRQRRRAPGQTRRSGIGQSSEAFGFESVAQVSQHVDHLVGSRSDSRRGGRVGVLCGI
jgi:hypothetical protein